MVTNVEMVETGGFEPPSEKSSEKAPTRLVLVLGLAAQAPRDRILFGEPGEVLTR